MTTKPGKPYRARQSGRRTIPYLQLQVLIPERLETRLDEEANRLSLSRTRWVIALIENHLANVPQSTRVGEVAMIEIHSELRRIRQILARLSLVAGESSADLSARLAAAQSEVAACKQRLEAAFAESGRYWRGS